MRRTIKERKEFVFQFIFLFQIKDFDTQFHRYVVVCIEWSVKTNSQNNSTIIYYSVSRICYNFFNPSNKICYNFFNPSNKICYNSILSSTHILLILFTYSTDVFSHLRTFKLFIYNPFSLHLSPKKSSYYLQQLFLIHKFNRALFLSHPYILSFLKFNTKPKRKFNNV